MKVGNPKVSIIIATYNSGKTLNAALDSVLNQAYQDWECIVVDGASKDNTIDIVRTYTEKDNRFRYISEPDKGVYDAFNKGWKIACGEWIHYLGSDDKLTPNGIADIMAASHEDVELMTGHCYIEKIDGTIKPCMSQGYSGCHQGKLVRRSVLERFNGFNLSYPILADYDLMVRMEKAKVPIINVDTYVAYFAMSGMSQKLKWLIERFKERRIIMQEHGLPNVHYVSLKHIVRDFLSINYRMIKSRLQWTHFW